MKLNTLLFSIFVSLFFSIYPLVLYEEPLSTQQPATTWTGGYCLGKKEIIKVKRKIAKGNGDAARRLSSHYGFYFCSGCARLPSSAIRTPSLSSKIKQNTGLGNQ
jgi:hypothetical protein